MRRLFVLFFLVLSSIDVYAQWEGCYRLYLKDKEGSDYCALSERSMQRRQKQGVELDATDISVSPRYLERLRREGWQVVACSRWLNSVVVRRPDGKAIEADLLAALPFVSSYCRVTDPVYARGRMSVQQRSLQGQSAYVDKWSIEAQLPISSAINDDYSRPMAEVRGEALHAAGYRGQGMLVAVLDGGFSLLPQLPFFASKVIGWYDCYAPTDSRGEELFRSSEHGSSVLSIMACDQRDGVWGTAPEADYFVIRTEYDATETPLEEDMWVVGAEYADSIGADLINSSLGYHTFDNAEYNASWSELCQGTRHISRGAAIACQKGMLVCSAAGNDRDLLWEKVAFPSDVRDVLTVGASRQDLQPASFSGAGWLSPYVKPDVSCRGERSWYLSPRKGQPTVGNGTSYASPFMCGLMASLWSAVPQMSAARLREEVCRSASQSQAPDSLLGYGIPNMEEVMEHLGIGQAHLTDIESPETVSSCYDLWGRRVSNRRQNGCFIVQNGKKYLLLPR